MDEQDEKENKANSVSPPPQKDGRFIFSVCFSFRRSMGFLYISLELPHIVRIILWRLLIDI